jgi:large subunit ribosomal protein L19
MKTAYITTKNRVQISNISFLKYFSQTGNNFYKFAIGDIIRLGIKIDEERVQYYEGLIIKKKNHGISKTITVRRAVEGIGTERVIPIYSPNIVSIECKRSSIVRRSKLYYIRKLSGKATRLKQRFKARK